MHVGNGKDRGGNDIKLKWFNSPTNLHRIWDSDLINLQELSYSEYSDYLCSMKTEVKLGSGREMMCLHIFMSREI